MLADLKRSNAKQWQLVKDEHTHCGGNCPRRAGKTYAAVMAALITGEAKPGAISLIISLNKTQLRRLYWDGGPSGIWALARKYDLKLEFNHTTLRWVHPNGSYGLLLGAEDDEQMDVLRGLEADLYIIDEAQAFPPARLDKLLTQVIEPQRASRKGKIILLGTPGYIPAGPFWRATCPRALDSQKRPYLVAYGRTDAHGRDLRKDRLWSHHHWTLQDNTALPHQWEEALITKAKQGWDDNHPVWRAEYLGEWTDTADGLVFRYGELRGRSELNWRPNCTAKNPSGLPVEGGPWRFIAGLDIGFEDATALVLAAYSPKLRQLRHVWDYSAKHLLVDDLAALIHDTEQRFCGGARIECIYADTGGLGKMLVETLIASHGFPIERAEKREKFDHIELLNSAFARGEVLVIENTVLEDQLLHVSWDLRGGSREEMAHAGRLREDPSVANDVADAFLYCFRGSLHRFGAAPMAEYLPDYGTPEWVRAWEKEQLRRARAEKPGRVLTNSLPPAPWFARPALQRRGEWIPSTPRSSRRS